MPSFFRFPILAGLASSALATLAATGPAQADRIRNPTAVCALQFTPRVCWTRPPTEAPQTDAFVEVDEVTVKNEYRRIFTGWMYAASPGLHGVEHAIYDAWLTDCKGGTELVVDPKEPEAPPAEDPRQPRTPNQPPAAQQPAFPPRGGRIDVEPPRGVPVQPQRPSQRFFPTNPSPGRDPTAGGG